VTDQKPPQEESPFHVPLRELHELCRIWNEGKRLRELAGWMARWIEVGHVQSDTDVHLAEHYQEGAPAFRAREDERALFALLNDFAAEKKLEVWALEDEGQVEVEGPVPGDKYKAWRSHITVCFLRAKPRES
jgi:hypothetical protein